MHRMHQWTPCWNQIPIKEFGNATSLHYSENYCCYGLNIKTIGDMNLCFMVLLLLPLGSHLDRLLSKWPHRIESFLSSFWFVWYRKCCLHSFRSDLCTIHLISSLKTQQGCIKLFLESDACTHWHVASLLKNSSEIIMGSCRIQSFVCYYYFQNECSLRSHTVSIWFST